MISGRGISITELIPEEGEQECRDEHNPESAHAAKQIPPPCPFPALESRDDTTSHEKATQDKEDHHRLVAQSGEEVEELGKYPRCLQLGKGNKEKSPQMLHDYKESCQTAQAIKMDETVLQG